MSTIEEFKEKYKPIPKELKSLKRWICYGIVENKETGEVKKIPIDPLNGENARTNDELTWSTFDTALKGCVKYDLYGIGFILGQSKENGETYFGIDLDNHPDKETGEKLSKEEFELLKEEFVNSLNSYSEYSHSGEGVHIICKGKLPEGARRKKGVNVEMYDKARFFTMTGKTINGIEEVYNREEEILPLWEKYLKSEEIGFVNNYSSSVITTLKEGSKRVITLIDEEDEQFKEVQLSDDQIIAKIMQSKQGDKFSKLFYYGDLNEYSGDHSSADTALCNILAFWCGGDALRLDRIFRRSALFREKWDEKRGENTYGEILVNKAISETRSVYVAREKVSNNLVVCDNEEIICDNREIVCENKISYLENIDNEGNVIIRINPSFDIDYEVSDTGNAHRLYDYFGDLFKYNKDSKCFMFWSGKSWLKDTKDGDLFIRKYADATKEILKEEIKEKRKKIYLELATIEGEDREKFLKNELKKITPSEANLLKISNKSGKDNMISELKHLKKVTVDGSAFDNNPFLLNTNSGIVDLKTGDIIGFNKELMQSKSTNCEVSFDEPTTWIKFLHEIFERKTPEETQELVDCVQKAVGYTLSGSVKEQCMFLLYGATGSNGKSTFIKQLQTIMGEYALTTPVGTLMSKQSGSKSTEQLYALSKLHSGRLVICGESEEGEKMSESTVKIMTGSDTIQARHPYGEEFDYDPTYKIWMLTNHKPIIRGQEYAIWRRLFFIPFEKTFDESNKDVNLPEKLKNETPKILGWAIKGFLKYQKEGLSKPKCVELALAEYKSEMNVITSYLKEQTSDFDRYETKASVIYQDYLNWARNNNEKKMSQTKFSNELLKSGYSRKLKSDGSYYVGIKLNSDTRGRIIVEDDGD